MTSNLSRDEIKSLIDRHIMIGLSDGGAAADAVWERVAAVIEEQEHRVIDAEFKATELLAALKPFALNPGAVSLGTSLGHITREDLLRAKAVYEQ